MMSTPSVKGGGLATFLAVPQAQAETVEPGGNGSARPAAVTAALQHDTVRLTASIDSREFKNAGFPLSVVMRDDVLPPVYAMVLERLTAHARDTPAR